MTPEIEQAPQVARDLRAIWKYIAERNEPAANKWIRDIQTTITRLGANPGIGALRDEIMPGLRSLPFRRYYLIFYLITPRGIRLVRVLHGRRNIKRLFRSTNVD